MRDVFGADGVTTEGNPTAAPPLAGAGMTVTAPTPGPAVAPPPGTTPTLQQATDKATAKAQADVKVATDPHVVHGTVTKATSPKSLGSTGALAAAGFLVGGPPGALLGAAAGFVAERYGIGGGPSTWWSKTVSKVKSITGKA